MNKTPAESPPSHRLMGMVFCLTRAHRRVVEKCFSGLDIHHSQHRLLMQLARSGQIPSQRELAKDLDVSPASLAVMLKRLAAAGYIEKTGSEEDSRRNRISITPAGREIVSKSCVYFDEIEGRMFEGVEPADAAAMARCLQKMHENLARYEEEMNASSETTKE